MSQDHHHGISITIQIAGFHEESKQMNRHIGIGIFFFLGRHENIKIAQELTQSKEWTLENVLDIVRKLINTNS